MFKRWATGHPFGVSPGFSYCLLLGKRQKRWLDTGAKGRDTLGKLIEELDKQELRNFVEEILDKKEGINKKSWFDIIDTYGIEYNADTIRKIGVGVKLARDAGMSFNIKTQDENNFIERQKLYDMQRNIRKDMRELSRTELICERISEAIKLLPEIEVPEVKIRSKNNPNTDLVIGIGDFHYGAEFNVCGLYEETINKYNSSVFEKRMFELLENIVNICSKENPEQVTIMVVGDMLDGILRTSQLQRLEFGVIESCMRLSETLAAWLVKLESKINIPIRVYAVRGNHGEIRPLGTKAGQFSEENMERIVMHYLYARFEKVDSITIAQDDAPMVQMVNVCGYEFLLTHGQNSNIESMAKDCVNLYKKPIDVFMVGHLHKSQSFASGILPETNIYVERVPSICGIDPYAQSRGYGAKPGATVILMEEGYGRRCVYPIILS